MNESEKREMTKEELMALLDEYRDKIVQLENEQDVLNKTLAMADERERKYMDTIANLSAALKNLAEAVA